MNKAKTDALNTVIRMFEQHLFAMCKAEYVHVGRVGGATYIRRGEGEISTNVFSVTKSIFAFWALLDYILNGAPWDVPLNKFIENLSPVVGKSVFLLSHKSVISLINHVSGIVTGATIKGKDGLAEVINTRILGDWFDAYQTLDKGVWFDETADAIENGKETFAYNNYAIQAAGIIIELFYASLHGIEKDGKKFTIRQECIDLLFPFIKRQIVWPCKNDKEARMHTCTFSGLELTGREMYKFAEHLYTQFRPILCFLCGDTLIKPDGSRIKNEFVVFAPDKNVNPGFATAHEYDYSWGFWLPKIKRRNGKLRRYVCCHGMFGQIICIDVDSGFIAVRKQNYETDQQLREILRSSVTKTSMNRDPSFDWYVSEFQEAVDQIEMTTDGDHVALRVAISNFEAALKVKY